MHTRTDAHTVMDPISNNKISNNNIIFPSNKTNFSRREQYFLMSFKISKRLKRAIMFNN